MMFSRRRREQQRERLREKGGLEVEEILVGMMISTHFHGNHLSWETLVEEVRLRIDEWHEDND